MTLKGIDISGWQKGINLAAVPADFVIIKATEGTNYVSSDADRQYQQARAAGRLLGVYHFASVGDATAQADWFVDHTAGYHDGRTILALDWETGPVVAQGAAWAKVWLDRVQARTGIKPLIYMSGSLAAQAQWADVVAAGYGLWVASWGSNAVGGYRDPGKVSSGRWPFYAIRQYASNGALPGYAGRLDLNQFEGDAAAWMKYAAKNGQVATPPAAPPAPPVQPAPTPAAPSGGTYTVRAGDTLSGIAAAHGTSWQAIYNANRDQIKNPNLIHAGQVLDLPGGSAKPQGSTARTYTVKAGDSLSVIAARFRVGSWKTLYTLNRQVIGANPNLIRAGQVLTIP